MVQLWPYSYVAQYGACGRVCSGLILGTEEPPVSTNVHPCQV